METITLKEIEPAENQQIAAIIRGVMKEFNANPEATILGDPSLNSMFENYQEERAVYYVAYADGKMLGGCGVKALDGGTEDICELQRLFLLPEVRGKGVGKKLIETCLQKAKGFGYRQIYLETLGDMQSAIALYSKFGFKKLHQPLGDTGHGGCDVWMLREL